MKWNSTAGIPVWKIKLCEMAIDNQGHAHLFSNHLAWSHNKWSHLILSPGGPV